jgi:hypothetical protein
LGPVSEPASKGFEPAPEEFNSTSEKSSLVYEDLEFATDLFEIPLESVSEESVPEFEELKPSLTFVY